MSPEAVLPQRWIALTWQTGDAAPSRPEDATRWRIADSGELLFLLEGDGAVAPDVSDFEIRSTRRWSGHQINPGGAAAPREAKGLVAVLLEPKPEFDEEFNAWYDTEHLPALAAVPGVLAARRYVASAGSTGYLAVYHLTQRDVIESEEWRAAARRTPWSRRIGKRVLEKSEPLLSADLVAPSGSPTP